ncbi:unnamed protein product [Caenorhabditis auriculariae]|uniref:FIP-RBD domain-containing protein n=1 Tax=Caenorhabditis auriculariae TaxID=2777116 RepID=A0A8S1HUW3_9PELO|nr:unnamed protein product [Caenorhabditis auriculariae]
MEPNTLLVTVGSARGLYLKNKTETEAYATITLQGKGSLRSRAATEFVHTQGDCLWDETCEFKLNEKWTTVCVSVQHKGKIGSGDLIGKCELSLHDARQYGSTSWFPLKKKSGDEKYRGEVQLCFKFSFEKPTLSVSSMSLNKVEKEGGVLSNLKKKIKMAKHKHAEDTMSMASGISAMSVKSNKSNRFFDKINRTFGSNKSTTLPPGTFLAAPGLSSPHLDRTGSSNAMYESCLNGSSRIANPENTIDNHSGYNPFDESPARSPVIGYAPQERKSTGSLQRGGSIRSIASSGFESSKHQQKQLDVANGQDLLAVIDSLKLELQVKDSRMKDMQEYMDNLISRVMVKNPELLAAPVGEKPKRRFF